MAEEAGLLPALARGVDRASRLAGIVSVGLIIAAIAVICQLLWVRFVLGQSAIWQNEFVTFALIAATFLGAPFVLLTRGHVNVDLVPLWARGEARRWLALLGGTIGLVFCLILFVTSLPWWWEAWEGGFTTSSVWRAPLWIPYLAVPLGTGLLVLQYVVELWAVATRRAAPFGMTEDGPGTGAGHG